MKSCFFKEKRNSSGLSDRRQPIVIIFLSYVDYIAGIREHQIIGVKVKNKFIIICPPIFS